MAPPIRKQRPTGRMTPPAKGAQAGQSAQSSYGAGSQQYQGGAGMQVKAPMPIPGSGAGRKKPSGC